MKYLLALAAVWFLTLPYNAHAEAVFEATQGDIRVVLHSDDCALKEVSNLPKKAVWHENGKQIEGCWGPNPQLGVIAMYFAADRTVGLAPIQAFKRLVGV